MLEAHLKNRFVEEDEKTYHANQGLSAHGFIELLKSPLQYRWRYIEGNRTESTDSQEFGTLTHYALLEPEKFESRLAVHPGLPRNTKAGKEADAAFTANLKPDAIVVWPQDLERIRGIQKSLERKEHDVAKNLLKGGVAELSGYWTDLDLNLPAKMRPDYVHHDAYLVDLKITSDARESEFRRRLGNYRYDIQAAWYLTGYANIQGKPFEDTGYLWVVIGDEAPYPIRVYMASQKTISRGIEDIRYAKELYGQCVTNGLWPSTTAQTGITEIDPPAWL